MSAKAGRQRAFPEVERFLSTMLGTSLAAAEPGKPVVVESEQRLRPELSYGFIRGLLGYWLVDGRIVISVPPGAGVQTARASCLQQRSVDLLDLTAAQLDELCAPAGAALPRAGMPKPSGTWRSLCFACNAETLRRFDLGDCRRLRDASIPPAGELHLPEHCFPDGIVYGAVEDEHVVSVAFAHRTGVMEASVADIGVETAAAYRRSGYGKTVVSAVTATIVEAGGEGFYSCNPTNRASQATALSVGYQSYARALVLVVPQSGGR